jgi:hypothetical protein
LSGSTFCPSSRLCWSRTWTAPAAGRPRQPSCGRQAASWAARWVGGAKRIPVMHVQPRVNYQVHYCIHSPVCYSVSGLGAHSSTSRHVHRADRAGSSQHRHLLVTKERHSGQPS